MEIIRQLIQADPPAERSLLDSIGFTPVQVCVFERARSRERDRQTERQTDRHTDKGRDIHIYREREIWIERQVDR